MAELWSEYLAVFWPHPASDHYCFKSDIVVNRGISAWIAGLAKDFWPASVGSWRGESDLRRTQRNHVGLPEKPLRSRNQKWTCNRAECRRGSHAGNRSFSFDSLDPFSGRMASAMSTVNIPVISPAKLCEDLQLPKVDFIKMDIEGAEI